jgi:hypothetical protein
LVVDEFLVGGHRLRLEARDPAGDLGDLGV